MALSKTQIQAMIVAETEVPTARRGRTMTVNEDLKAVLGALESGQAARLTAVLGKTDNKNEQSKIAQRIRSHWKLVHPGFNPSIGWVNGEPSVKFGKPVEKASA